MSALKSMCILCFLSFSFDLPSSYKQAFCNFMINLLEKVGIETAEEESEEDMFESGTIMFLFKLLILNSKSQFYNHIILL